MTKHTGFARTAAALRELDPATTTALTEQERQRADAVLARILTAPITAPAAALDPTAGHEPDRTETDPPGRRRHRLLIPVALLASAAVTVSMVLGGGSAFASWTARPEMLPPPARAAAASTCRAVQGIPAQSMRVVIGERRGGWTYILLAGPGGEGSCLMPDDLIGASGYEARRGGFFGHYALKPPEAPTPARDSLIETESAAGAVPVPGRLSFGTRDGWFMYVTGYAGRDVARVSVDAPAGPDVEASLQDGRFAAWWPAGEARGDNPAMDGEWSYTVTLADGTTRRV